MGVSKKDDKKVKTVMEIILPYVKEYVSIPTWGKLAFHFENSVIKYVKEEKVHKVVDFET